MHIKVHNVCSAAIEIIMELQKKKKLCYAQEKARCACHGALVVCSNDVIIKRLKPVMRVVVSHVTADRPVMARTEITRPRHARPSNVVKFE